MPFDGFVENTQVTDRLLIGRARIKAGWCQQHLHLTRWTWLGRRDEYCVVGAVNLEHRPHRDIGDVALGLIVAAQAELGYGRIEPMVFNDARGRTKAQVLEVLDVAIAMSRGEYHDRDRRNQ